MIIIWYEIKYLVVSQDDFTQYSDLCQEFFFVFIHKIYTLRSDTYLDRGVVRIQRNKEQWTSQILPA